MSKIDGTENLVAARNLLKNSLENSRALASALNKTEGKLEGLNQRLSSLEAGVRPVPMQKCTFAAVRDQIDTTIAPAVALLKVYHSVRDLEKSLLSDPCYDLSNYLTLVKQLEEALKFLSDICGLVIQWLQGVLQFLEDNAVANDPYIFKVKKSLRILTELQALESRAGLNGGILFAALEKLEVEFKHLVTENCVVVDLAYFTAADGDKPSIAPSLLPDSVLKKLQAIVGRLNGNDRLQNCLQAYIEIRSRNARRSLEVLDLNYLDRSITETDDVQDIESCIDQWCKHFKLAIKHVYEVEFCLSKDVFEKIGSSVWMHCFAKIATQSGIFRFLQFGRKITECKKDPIKLFKLLDMFACLDNLRADFNRLFGGESWIEVQELTRDVIKRVINGSCEIFLGLPYQIELQRQIPPPLNGGVPKLVRFVTDFCDELLGDTYRPLLRQVLQIYQCWKQEKYSEELVSNQIYFITKQLGLNLDSWSRSYKNVALSYLFMMNNHSHFCNIKGTKFGDLMGGSWFKAHEQYQDYYMAIYIRETWGKVIAILSQDGHFFNSSTSNSAIDLAKKLRAFNEAIDDMCQKQSYWIVCNEDLRLKMCKIVVQGVVPVYRSFLQNYGILVEQNGSPRKYVKYTVQGLENMLSSLFEPKIIKFGSTKNTHFIDRIRNIVTDQFRFTLMAV